jgi:putative intracellular protease/amidase
MDVVILVFNGVTSSEILAPVGALSAQTAVTVHLVGPEKTTYHGFEPLREFRTEHSIDRVEDADLLLIPGGLGSLHMMQEQPILDWVRRQAARSRIVMSVSTGSLLLAGAGLLQEADASGHWLAHDVLEAAGAHAAEDPVTWSGKYVTTSGVVAAADVARALRERIEFGPPEG